MYKFGHGVMRIFTILSLFFISALTIQCTSQQEEAAQEENETSEDGHRKALEDVPELADAMGQLQKYAHKYALAVEAENHELATFYFHEVRASTDDIKANIPGYEGYDIARFMTLMFDPTIEPVQTALDNRNWEEIRERTIDMINGCNACHNATSHGFIKVTPGFDNNPYNQDFSAPE